MKKILVAFVALFAMTAFANEAATTSAPAADTGAVVHKSKKAKKKAAKKSKKAKKAKKEAAPVEAAAPAEPAAPAAPAEGVAH